LTGLLDKTYLAKLTSPDPQVQIVPT
jgi:hypothetical protein